MRTLRHRPRGEGGSAVVEFVFLAVLVMVPLFYLVMTLARVQAGAYAASVAAREAARAYVTSPGGAQALARADAAARVSFEDQGFRSGEGAIGIGCDGTPCLRAGGHVKVTARVAVSLPFVPDFARGEVPLEVTLKATHLEVVDRFRVLR